MRGGLQRRSGYYNKMVQYKFDINLHDAPEAQHVTHSIIRVASDGHCWAWHNGTKENCKRVLYPWSGRRWAKYNKEIPF